MTEEITQPTPETETEDWKDKYLRLLADQENLRKRAQKERQESLHWGIENAIGEFLPAIDQLENAVRFSSQASEEVRNWARGFEMILAQFKEILESHGITAIPTEGAPFDPYLHEAVEIEESSEKPEGTILQEFSRGYQSKTRTIRPARVKVTRLPENTNVEGVDHE